MRFLDKLQAAKVASHNKICWRILRLLLLTGIGCAVATWAFSNYSPIWLALVIAFGALLVVVIPLQVLLRVAEYYLFARHTISHGAMTKVRNVTISKNHCVHAHILPARHDGVGSAVILALNAPQSLPGQKPHCGNEEARETMVSLKTELAPMTGIENKSLPASAFT